MCRGMNERDEDGKCTTAAVELGLKYRETLN